MKKIIITPMAGVEQELLQHLAQSLSQVLGLDAAVGSVMDEPPKGFHRRRRQYDAAALLDQLSPSSGDTGFTVLGITGLDLFVRGLNFVFGLADRQRSLAVVSTARLRPEYYGQPPDAALLEERLLKECIHELGHILGLDHCQRPGCIMIFSNAIEDTDRKGPGFCGNCLQKLTGLDGKR